MKYLTQHGRITKGELMKEVIPPDLYSGASPALPQEELDRVVKLAVESTVAASKGSSYEEAVRTIGASLGHLCFYPLLQSTCCWIYPEKTGMLGYWCPLVLDSLWILENLHIPHYDVDLREVISYET